MRRGVATRATRPALVLCVAGLLAGCGSRAHPNAAPASTSPPTAARTSAAPAPTSPTSPTKQPPAPDAVAFDAPSGNGTKVAVIRAGLALPVPASLRSAGSSYPVAWADRTGRRLLVAQAAREGTTPDYLVLDVGTGQILGGPTPADAGMGVAADDPSILGGVDSNRVYRYDNQLREVRSAIITGLPAQPPGTGPHQSIDLLGVRSSGVVVALPGSDGAGRDTSAYGGPERIATIDWQGHGHLLAALPYFNVAFGGSAVSPDGTKLAVVVGARAGAADNEFAPRIVDLASGASVAAPRPPALADATELSVHDLHWVDAATVAFAWENSGANGDWSTSAPGNVAQIPPTVYTWSPGHPPVAGATETLFTTTLSGGPLAVGWSTSAAAAQGPFPITVAGKTVGATVNRHGPPVTPGP